MHAVRRTLTILICGVCVVVGGCFLYAGGSCARTIMDQSLRAGRTPVWTVRWFGRTSRRFSTWGEGFLSSQRAACLYHRDIPGTEWPIFGAVMYLLAAQELQRDSTWLPAHQRAAFTTDVVRAAGVAARMINDPVTATWVRKKWGTTYLSSQNLFYRMLLIMGCAAYEDLTGDHSYRATLELQTRTLGAELLRAPHLLLEDYPGECYPNDVLWAVAALRRADALLGTDHTQLATQFMARMTKPDIAPHGLPAYAASAVTGRALGPARGCSNSGMLLFAADLDPAIAAHWYARYTGDFWVARPFVCGFREVDHSRQFMTQCDPDAGPVIGGFGTVASALGIGAARRHGRLDQSVPLTQQAVACSFPTPWGWLAPSLMGWLAADAPPLGEVALAFAMTRPLPQELVRYDASAPGLVWLLTSVYIVAGVLLLWCAMRCARKIVRWV